MTTTNYPEVIVNVNNINKTDIYQKLKSWINRTYKNPDIVTKADEKNNYIRISGVDSFYLNYMGTQSYPLNYDFEINIKDGKYKISFMNVKSPGLNHPDMPSGLFDSKGDARGNKKLNLKMQKAILNTLNNIHFSIYNYLTTTEKDW